MYSSLKEGDVEDHEYDVDDDDDDDEDGKRLNF